MYIQQRNVRWNITAAKKKENINAIFNTQGSLFMDLSSTVLGGVGKVILEHLYF